jgi:hypothetical protein
MVMARAAAHARRCDFWRRVSYWAVIASGLIPATALAGGVSGAFKGTTSQGKRVVIKVSHGVVEHGSKIPFSLKCHHGAFSALQNPSGKLRRGRFSTHSPVNAAVGGGLRAMGQENVRFVVRTRVVTGTFSENDRIVTGSGTIVDRCSASLTFKATR